MFAKEPSDNSTHAVADPRDVSNSSTQTQVTHYREKSDGNSQLSPVFGGSQSQDKKLLPPPPPGLRLGPAPRSSRSSSTRYECELACGKSFGRPADRNRHVFTIHSPDRVFICNRCDHYCYRKHRMREHCRDRHGEGTDFVSKNKEEAGAANYFSREAKHPSKADDKCKACGRSGQKRKHHRRS